MSITPQGLDRLVLVQIDERFWEEGKRAILHSDYGMVKLSETGSSVLMHLPQALKLRALLPVGAMKAIGTQETPESREGTVDHMANYMARQQGRG